MFEKKIVSTALPSILILSYYYFNVGIFVLFFNHLSVKIYQKSTALLPDNGK